MWHYTVNGETMWYRHHVDHRIIVIPFFINPFACEGIGEDLHHSLSLLVLCLFDQLKLTKCCCDSRDKPMLASEAFQAHDLAAQRRRLSCRQSMVLLASSPTLPLHLSTGMISFT
jgi:hypothetical protein